MIILYNDSIADKPRFFPKIDAAEGGGINFVGIGGRAAQKLMANGRRAPI